MEFKALYIWVEGNKDFRFFDNVIKPIFKDRYDYVQIILIQMKNQKNKN